MHDPIPTKVSGPSCSHGAAGQGACLVECKGVCRNGPIPVARHASQIDSGNEAVARLERLRKRYKEAGDVAGVKYMVAAIRALRRGAE